MKKIILTLILSLFLSSYFLAKDRQVSADNAKIVSGQIAGNAYYVPKIYLAPPFSSIGKDTIYVRLMYPDFYPVLEDPQKLWKDGEWYRNIRVLAQHFNNPADAKKQAEVAIDTQKAYSIIGEEYGLLHRKQPEKEVQDLWDVWLENYNDKVLSYITCTEMLSKSSVPQCEHHMYWKNFHVTTAYDKRLLPEWKAIKQNTLAMLESFQSEKSARLFLSQHLPAQNSSK